MMIAMKRRRGTTPKRTSPSSAKPGKVGPALPAWKAFVVQFSRETEPDATVFAGRVEHLSSGRRAHFDSADELLAKMRQLLGDATAPVE
jgi:hypothetical protein